MTNYSKAVPTTDYDSVKKANLGSVAGYVTKTFTFEAKIDAVEDYVTDGADEFIITVNGRMVKRMNRFQAERIGLVR